ncbi:MAG: YkgJ family cysteine cluster protein [Planctomycetes bacterium]|nr:YkgJ family cysteine cluster protein [Planctomycetota bacterium]
MSNEMKQQGNSEVWYANGLKFKCIFPKCIRCCCGEPGYVWLADGEIENIADFLRLKTKEFSSKYTFKLHGRVSLNEKKDFDCIFLDREKGCEIYQVRPQQCSSYPFWPEILGSVESWHLESQFCPGINHGEVVSFEEIQRKREKKVPPLWHHQ